jgi:hypothetical protein
MEFYGHILSGKFTLPQEVKDVRAKYLASLPEGAAVSEKIGQVGRPKTNQQVRAFWGWLMPYAKAAFDGAGWDVDGVPLVDEQIKRNLYDRCGHVGDNGEMVTISKMTTIQMAQFFENCCAFLAVRFGVVVPDPDPAWRVKAKQRT